MEVTRPPDELRLPAKPKPPDPPELPEPATEDEKEKLLSQAFEVIIERLRVEIDKRKPNGQQVTIDEAVDRALACEHEPVDFDFEMQYQIWRTEEEMGAAHHLWRKGTPNECFRPITTITHNKASRQLNIQLCGKCRCLYWEEVWE